MYTEDLPALNGYIFDTHAHYDDEAFDGDRDALLRQIHEYGVCGIINCACSKQSALTTLRIAHEYDFVYAAVGLHPEETEPYDQDWIIEAAKDEKCVAIGEIGLDYHWDSVPRDLQKQNFEAQLLLANKLGLPVIIHDREAHCDTFEILERIRPSGVLHCYSGSAQDAVRLVESGMYIGVGGSVTFNNARKAVETVAQIPLERILLETDAPYMSPVPMRGQRCHSAMICHTAIKIAQIKGLSVETVLTVTRQNAIDLFKIAL